MTDDLQQPVQSPVAGDVVRDQDKIMLVLAYFGIFGLIPFLTVKDSQYVRWHARQGLTLSVGVVVVQIGLMVVAAIAGMVVHALAAVFGCLNAIIGLAYFVVAIMGIVKAIGGERWRIPVVADLAEKINI